MRKDTSKKLRLVIVAVALVAGAMACRDSKPPATNANRPPEPAPAPAATPNQPEIVPVEAEVMERASPFNHNRAEHKKIDCTVCHQRTDNEAAPKFPGHSACNDCHQKDFSSATSVLCAGCHKMPVDAQAQMISFPAKLKQLGLKGFSHRQHLNLDPGKLPAGIATLKCDSCHRLDRGAQASFPKHPECYSCHTHQAGEKLGECSVCHTDRTLSVKYSPGFGTPTSLYNFKHGAHTGRASCDRCHGLTKATGKTSDILQISTARGQRHNSTCFACHSRVRETVCTKCHVGSVPF
jgi:hypothetical protein